MMSDRITLSGLRAAASWILILLFTPLAASEIARYIFPVFGLRPGDRSRSLVAFAIPLAFVLVGFLCSFRTGIVLRAVLAYALVVLGINLALGPFAGGALSRTPLPWICTGTGVVLTALGFFLLRERRPDPAEPPASD
jgi:hypothetical protein